ncbi:MAG: hypothetical protein AAGC81_18250, partial [Pseudomonadota bacterium]
MTIPSPIATPNSGGPSIQSSTLAGTKASGSGQTLPSASSTAGEGASEGSFTSSFMKLTNILEEPEVDGVLTPETSTAQPTSLGSELAVDIPEVPVTETADEISTAPAVPAITYPQEQVASTGLPNAEALEVRPGQGEKTLEISRTSVSPPQPSSSSPAAASGAEEMIPTAPKLAANPGREVALGIVEPQSIGIRSTITTNAGSSSIATQIGSQQAL